MLVITRLTFHEAFRRRIVWVALVLGVLFLVVYALGVNAINAEMQTGDFGGGVAVGSTIRAEAFGFLVLAGLYVVNFLSLMMTVLTSVDTISGEIATGTVHTLLSKPIRRWEVLLGKWLGFALMLTLYLILMVGGVVAVVYFFSGYLPPNVLKGFGLIWLTGVLLLTLSLLGGTRLSTLANGVLVFGLYSVAFVGGWIEQIGALLQNRTAVEIGIIASLLMPGEALWRRAAFEMQSPLAGSLGASPFSSVSVPSPLMVVFAIGYTLVALGLAIRWFGQRDL